MLTKPFDKFHPNQNWYKKHRFSPEIKGKIAKLHQLDNWHGILQVLEDFVWILIAIAFSLWSWQHLPLIVAFSIYCLAVLIIGARQRGLRVNNHQATHKALAKSKHLNYSLATLLGSWLVLESFSGYDDTHNSKLRGHHPNLGTANDVDHVAVVVQGLYDKGCTGENVKLYLLSIPWQTPNYILFLLKNRIWNSQEDSTERIIRLLYFTALVGGFIYLGWGQYFLIYWIVPLFTTANWLGSFIQLAEHYPLIATSEPFDLYLSRNRLLSPLANLFLGTHGEGYHLIHHLFPCLPFWQMKKAHQILMQDEVYTSIHQEAGMTNLVKQIIYS